MKKTLSVLCSLMILAGPVLADTTYYVGVGGNNANDGLTYATRWATLSYANSALPSPNTANGHIIVNVYPGTHNALPNPISAAADGKRYFFYGDVANPQNTVMPAGTVTKPYVSIAGFRINGDFTLARSGQFDTVRHCQINGDASIHGDYSGFRNSTMSGYLQIARPDQQGVSYRISGIDVRWITGITRLSLGSHGSGDLHNRGDSCNVAFNTIVSTINGTDSKATEFHHARNLTLRGNRYTIRYTGGTPSGTMVWTGRDSIVDVAMDCDTVIVWGGNATIGLWQGNQPGEHRVVDSCYFQASGDGNNFVAGTLNLEPANKDTITRTTFVSNGIAYYQAANVVGSSMIDHCTFVSAVTPAVKFETASGWAGAKGMKFRNNILYSQSPTGPLLSCGTIVNDKPYRVAAMYLRPSPSATNYGANHNLYSFYGYTTTPGDHSIVRESSGAWSCVAAGDTSVWKNDTLSVYGSPRFNLAGGDTLVNTANATIFDARIGAGSRAIGTGEGSSDIGAVAYTGPGLASLVSRNPIAFVDLVNNQVVQDTIVVLNAGTGNLGITGVTVSSPSLVVTPTTATVSAGATQKIYLTYTAPPDLNPGAYSPTPPPPLTYIVTIATDDPVRPTIVVEVVVNRGVFAEE